MFGGCVSSLDAVPCFSRQPPLLRARRLIITTETIIRTDGTTTVVTPYFDTVAEAAFSAASAKSAKVMADNGWKVAEQDCLESFIANDVKTAIITTADGTFARVTAEGLDEVSRSIDIEKALTLLNSDQLDAVACVTIPLSAIDAAIKMGIIPEALAEQFIFTKQTKPSVRVTFNVKNVDVK